MTYSNSHTPKLKPILGYTTRIHLLLDLDNTTLTKTTALVRLLMEQYAKIGDALVLESSLRDHTERQRYSRTGRIIRERSLDNHHVVFNNKVGYNFCCHIIETLSGLGILNEDYAKIRQFRGDMTLRVSPAFYSDHVKNIPLPKTYIVNQHCIRQDDMIWQYLKMLAIASQMFPAHAPLFSLLSSLQKLDQ